MEYFDRYTSATIAAGGNQHIFWPENPDREMTGRVFYRIDTGGRQQYSLLYSNIIDSTFFNGDVSHRNYVCDAWQIHSLRLGRAESCGMEVMATVTDWQTVTFDGKPQRTVAPGEFLATDPVCMEIPAGQYLCVELVFSGRELPHHAETILPVFRLESGRWQHSPELPLPGMVGVERPVKKKVAFFGDSITQGIGTEPNTYTHWNALVARRLGTDYAFWNLGLGFGRASDAATDGAWMFKAKQNDIAVVCFGVNDMFRENPESIIPNLDIVVQKLKAAGLKVILQTLPPFEYNPQEKPFWLAANRHILQKLAPLVDGVVDTVPFLGAPEPHTEQYIHGRHPDAEGCRLWADALTPVLQRLLDQPN